MAVAKTFHYTNFTNGWIIETTDNGTAPCESFILLPAENLWNLYLRGILYIVAMLYLFIGVAIASDIFMGSIEVITSKKKTVIKWDEEKQEKIERKILIWNETVANLTLMALGSSAPEILLAIVEGIRKLSPTQSIEDSLGVFTIIGSAAFNLLMITSICIISVPYPQVKKVREVGVFIQTSIWSIFAYVWMLVVVNWNTKGIIDIWEAVVTLLFFPLMVLLAYCQDNGWWCKKKAQVSGGDGGGSVPNIRILDSHHHRASIMHHPARELQQLEHEKAMRQSHHNMKSITESRPSLCNTQDGEVLFSRPTTAARRFQTAEAEKHVTRARSAKLHSRFRHAAVRALLGHRRKNHHHDHHHSDSKGNLADIVDRVQSIHNLKTTMPEDLVGKFTFAAHSYSVLESAGILEIDVLFHRRMMSKTKRAIVAHSAQWSSNQFSDNDMGIVENGGTNTDIHSINTPDTETTFLGPPDDGEEDVIKGEVTVEYETREGSGKLDKDFKYTKGSLTFAANEYCKTVTVPIVNDNQYEADVDFYVILKNPSAEAGLGDPSVARVTIIDDDEPGELTFEKPHYSANPETGKLIATVLREHGCDGQVTIEYSTIDGTAKGGPELGPGFDYVTENGVLVFKHGETSKIVTVDVNKNPKGNLNFIIALKNPSVGSRIGEHSATIASITGGKKKGGFSDALGDRIADALDDEDEEEELDWGGQFRAAFEVGGDEDEDGNEQDPIWLDYFMHFFTFFWKVLHAFIPPKMYLGAWPTFVVSILYIAGLTAIIETLGGLLGCVVNLKPAVTGITIVALGTSIPDTFASRTAALQDEGADAAIGNVTGSNSVNVFLGLGLPWCISVIYYTAIGQPFYVKSTNLTQAVIVFSVIGTVCIIILLLRRKVVGGELGGEKKWVKYVSGGFLAFLWIFYVTFEALVVYSVITVNIE
ncbi:sodium/calcium exchanger 2 isoform X2 [Lingula anatina]|uniref:Sodium/calcium exchanger 2 isoform X2 n=1 Tax=Lingula anatina TaxID=7574 RepID=A0A1S3K7G1_LINAN|nr:sodium/calcium exchanger 2 isoform X2 [Lingula anatina]|eukprot:XP_013418432.1 sodium/calcium exchanger 2 isoform X2 [Lingula anatina]